MCRLARAYGLRHSAMLSIAYRRRIASMVIQLAKEDPHLVKDVIARLKKQGDIELDDLAYLDRIADRWIEIAKVNRQRGMAAQKGRR